MAKKRTSRTDALLEHADTNAFRAVVDAKRCDVLSALNALGTARESFGAAKESKAGVSADDQKRVGNRINEAERAIEKCCAKRRLSGVARKKRKR